MPFVGDIPFSGPPVDRGGNQENQAVAARVEHFAIALDRVDPRGVVDFDSCMAAVRDEIIGGWAVIKGLCHRLRP